MFNQYRAIRQRRAFTNVDAITTSVTVHGEHGWRGSFPVDVNVTNAEYRSGRYRQLVFKAATRTARERAAKHITYRAIGDVWVCLDGKWHKQDMAKWPMEED